ncbi:hypothetical protein L9F63_000864, partial [Diploptera punctata]
GTQWLVASSLTPSVVRNCLVTSSVTPSVTSSVTRSSTRIFCRHLLLLVTSSVTPSGTQMPCGHLLLLLVALKCLVDIFLTSFVTHSEINSGRIIAIGRKIYFCENIIKLLDAIDENGLFYNSNTAQLYGASVNAYWRM